MLWLYQSIRMMTVLSPWRADMSIRAILAFTAWSLLMGASTANAAGRVALVIGNSSYASVSNLPNPRNDAEDIAVALRDLGFDVVDGRDLDRRGMADVVRRFLRILPGSEVALFFYAGHGVQAGGDNYMLPTDVRVETLSDVKFDAVNVNTVIEEMGAEKRTSLIFLDVCRDNPFSKSLALGNRSISGRGLARQESGVGTLIAFATQPNNVALDGNGRNSPFTQALLKHLKTPGLEIRTMLSRVRSDVIEITGGKQIPWENSSLTGDVVLVPAASSAVEPKLEASANESDTELSFWHSVERIGTKAAFEAYRRRFGSEGRFTALADERIAALSIQSPSNVQSPGHGVTTPASLPNVQDTIDQKSTAKGPEGVRPVRNLKSQSAKKAVDGKTSSGTGRAAVRLASPSRTVGTHKKQGRAAPQTTPRPEPQVQYSTAPLPEPPVQQQYQPVPATLLTVPFGRHGHGSGFGIGLGGFGLGFGHRRN